MTKVSGTAERLAVPRTVSDAIRAPRRAGALVMLAFVGGFGGWAALAPLAGGAIAPGQISPDSGVRTVEHLEGGLVNEIRVREGDFVQAGTVLVTIDVTGTQAEADALSDRRLTRLAEQARLAAESTGAADLVPSDEIAHGTEASVAVLAAERRTLAARRSLQSARERVFAQRIGQLGEKAAGHQLQAHSAAEQLTLMREELADKSSLLGKGLAAKAEVLRLRRLIAEAEGLRGTHLAAVAEAREEIGEIELNLKANEAEDAEHLARRAAEVRNELAEINNRLSALRAVIERSALVAPVDGTVSNLRIRNAGAVLNPGEPVLDLVPAGERLLIDAQVAPNDIDAVALGMTAQVQVSAYSGRTMRRIEGHVTMISPDTAQSDGSAATFYPIRVEVDPEEFVDTGIQLRSGMLVNVLVVTRERPVLSYLFEPIQGLLDMAMREV